MEYKGSANDDDLNQATLRLPDWASLWGLGGADTLTVGMGVAVGGSGPDVITGTSRYSTAAYYDSTGGIRADLSTGQIHDGNGSIDTVSNIHFIQGSGKQDTVLGSARADNFWSFGNDDFFDGAGGIDTARISISDPKVNPEFTRTADGLKISYRSHAAETWTLTTKNVEILEIYRGDSFPKWDLTAATPYQIPDLVADRTPRSLSTENGQWTPGKWGLVRLKISENVGTWNYPTPADVNSPGNLAIDAHNAALGDFNGDGYQDIVVTWVCFPHVIPHTTRPAPSVLFGSPSGLTAAAAGSVPDTAARHQGYRTWSANLNGDGIDDIVTGAMISPSYRSETDKSIVWNSDPTLAMLGSRQGAFSDISDRLEGQTRSTGAPDSSFDHATAVGDLNGDRIDDIFSGDNLWISASGGRWLEQTNRISALVPQTSPMALGIGDVNNDGRNDIVALYPDFSGDRIILFNNGSGSNLSFTRYNLPSSIYGSNSKNNNLVIGDVNGDGLNDIVVSETRALPYYTGSAIQLLIQRPNGTFTDETAARIDNTARDAMQGEGVVWLLDMNGDGHKDIVHSNGGDGVAIFLNDGVGRFELYSNKNINFITSIQLGLVGYATSLEELPQMRAYPVDENHDGIMDLLVQAVAKENPADPNSDITVNLYVISSTGNEFGRNASEHLKGSAAADLIYGLAGDDTLVGGAGNDTLKGGAGIDSVVQQGKLSDYRIAVAGGNGTVTSSVTAGDGIDVLEGIERIRFADFEVNMRAKSVAASVSPQTLQRVTELYIAFFNRTPDADGVSYWLTQAQAGMDIATIADAFYSAGVQYTALTGFSSTMSNGDFVNVVYRNVLGRKDGADSEGLAYWSGELASGKATRGSLVSTMLDSAHSFKGNATWGWVADLLDNKVDVAKRVAIDWGLNYLSADAAITHGMAIAKAVTSTDTATAISLVGIATDAIQLA